MKIINEKDELANLPYSTLEALNELNQAEDYPTYDTIEEMKLAIKDEA